MGLRWGDHRLDERLLIQGYAEGFGVTRKEVYDWWLTESGPV